MHNQIYENRVNSAYHGVSFAAFKLCFLLRRWKEMQMQSLFLSLSVCLCVEFKKAEKKGCTFHHMSVGAHMYYMNPVYIQITI